MPGRYSPYIDRENEIYRSMKLSIPQSAGVSNVALDRGLDWVSKGAHRLLDFGCGNGSMLFSGALRGVPDLIGIDLSSEGIALARKRAAQMPCGAYHFIHGGVEVLFDVKEKSVDAVILSNILDNLFIDDANTLLAETARILCPNGRLLVKLNPLLSPQQIENGGIRVLEDDLLDDGLLLWNRTTEAWRMSFSEFFEEVECIDVYFPEHEQHNRMFLLKRSSL